jgi:bacteriorhodopsin
MALAGSSAWASLLVSRRRDTDAVAVAWTLATTTAAIAVLAVTMIGMILREDPSEFSFRLLGVVAVLAVLGTLLLPIVRRIGGQARTE